MLSNKAFHFLFFSSLFFFFAGLERVLWAIYSGFWFKFLGWGIKGGVFWGLGLGRGRGGMGIEKKGEGWGGGKGGRREGGGDEGFEMELNV